MTALRLHTSLYPAEVVRSSVAVYRDYGQFEVIEDGDYLTVTITAGADVDESDLAGELANHALVRAVQTRRHTA